MYTKSLQRYTNVSREKDDVGSHETQERLGKPEDVGG